jgi:hypothetical protein
MLVGLYVWQPASGRAEAAASVVPGVVKATRFELVDAEGKSRVVLSADRAVWLSFLDSKGIERMALGTEGNGMPEIAMMDQKKMAKVMLLVSPVGTGLMISDGKNNTRLSAGLEKDDTPLLNLFDAKGNVLFKAP